MTCFVRIVALLVEIQATEEDKNNINEIKAFATKVINWNAEAFTFR